MIDEAYYLFFVFAQVRRSVLEVLVCGVQEQGD